MDNALAAAASDPVTVTLLLAHSLSSLVLIPFNSWVNASWFLWPSFRSGLPRLTRYYEFLGLWRICNAYGVFPPGTMSSLRQIPVFQVSQDGKTSCLPAGRP